MYIKYIYMTFTLHPGVVIMLAVGEAFYTGELEHEIREVGQVDFWFKKDSDSNQKIRIYCRATKAPMYPHLEPQSF